MKAQQVLLGALFVTGLCSESWAQTTAAGAGPQVRAPGRVQWKMDHYTMEARDWDWVLQVDTTQGVGAYAATNSSHHR